MKLDEIEFDVLDLRNGEKASDQQIGDALNGSLESIRGYNNLLLASNSSIQYTEWTSQTINKYK